MSPVVIPGPVVPPVGDQKPWPTVEDCADRLGVDPADEADMRALQNSLDGQTVLVMKAKPELVGAILIDADYWQGLTILACLDYKAANSPSGFAGFDGGLPSGDQAEKFRAQQLLRIDRFQTPRVG